MDNLNWSDNPAAIEAMLAGYALGDLTAAEMAEVEAYIAAHPAASVELADFGGGPTRTSARGE
jgi:anti-sigma factor RsiW